MLAKRRILELRHRVLERTPLLVPSFSSKGFSEVQKIVEVTQEVIEGPTLVSAYDIHYKNVVGPLTFPSLIFLDSGGYEASRDADLSDISEHDFEPNKWTREMHESVLASWSSSVPTIFISYDHPRERLTIAQQIERAKTMAPGRDDVLREILLKPETEGQHFLKIESVLPHAKALSEFDIVGVTEKEIGNSILTRMENIARLRRALDSERMDVPIHIFGSLDTITTPMYFLAGADIFDGLTWLRFAYRAGYTIYKHNFGALDLGVKTRAHVIDGRCWFHNYSYLIDMQLEMFRFLNGHDFSSFKYHSSLFADAHSNMMEGIGAH
jgi:hypothetical protein